MVLQLLTLKIFCTLFYCFTTEIRQINAGWACKTIASHTKFVFSNCQKNTIVWAGKTVGLNVLNILIHPT